MKTTVKIYLVVLLTLIGCTESTPDLLSEWSQPVKGLKIRISSKPWFERGKRDLVELEVMCQIKNGCGSPIAVGPLSRLHLIDKAGVTYSCRRLEDVAYVTFRLNDIPPGEIISWKQDGHIEVATGIYELFATWDGDSNLRSPTLKVTIK